MEAKQGTQKSSPEVLLESLNLTVGKKIKLIKTAILTSSSIPVGDEMNGTLATDVKIGQPIDFGKRGHTSSILRISRENGKVFFTTDTSVYEMIIEKKKLPEIHPNLSQAEFLADWENQFGDFQNPIYLGQRFFYQAPKTSINAQFSSKGWKLHIQFQKGWEKPIASLLNTYGQYFKMSSLRGSWFNGNTDSGATIYVGSRENLEKLIALIEEKCSNMLSARNQTTTVSGKEVYGGSGSDEPIGLGLAARFDISKSGFKDKYSEYGFATFLEFRGLPILQKDVLRVRKLEDIIENTKGDKSQDQRKQAYIELQKIFAETEQEILKDFGKEFVYGK
jgi:hypothetical protein